MRFATTVLPPRAAVLVLLAAIYYPLSAGAQSVPRAVSPEAKARMERAHRAAERAGRAAADIAGALTEQAADIRPRADAAPGPIPRRNFIDDRIFGRIEKDGIPHAPLAGDREFIRRAYLDATGRIPRIEDLAAFLSDADPDKRDKLIDRLTASDEFVTRWSYYFEDLFRAGNRMGFGKNLFHYWIEEWLRLDRSYADVVADLLTQGGKSSHSSPGALYFARDFVKALDDPEQPDAHDLVNRPDSVDEFTITYGKVFLGVNLGCISCHDGAHHLEQVNLFLTGKTRENFFQQAAFFGKTRMLMNWENGFQANTEYTVDDVEPGYPTKAESIVRVPRWGGDNTPRFILTGEAAAPERLPRDELARLVTADLQFARATVNRIWGRVDGLRHRRAGGRFRPGALLPPTRRFPRVGASSRRTVFARRPGEGFSGIRFQLQASGADDHESERLSPFVEVRRRVETEYAAYYPRKFVRILSGPELHDAVAVATSKPGSYKSGDGEAPLAMELLDPAHADTETAEFLRAFGQQSRDEMPSRTPSSALQAMLLMNSEIVLDRVKAAGNSRVEQLLARRADDRVLVTDALATATGATPDPQAVEAALDRGLVKRIYLATLARSPLPAEMDIALTALGKDRERGLENLQWALLNKPEFLFNY